MCFYRIVYLYFIYFISGLLASTISGPTGAAARGLGPGRQAQGLRLRHLRLRGRGPVRPQAPAAADPGDSGQAGPRPGLLRRPSPLLRWAPGNHMTDFLSLILGGGNEIVKPWTLKNFIRKI